MSYRTILCFLLCLAGISAGAQGSASGSGIAGQESSEEERQFAVTEFSVNYMRIAPDYESALETQELMGTPVEVTERRGYWCRIVSPQPYTAWATDQGLAFMGKEETDDYIAAPKYIVTSLHGTVFERPSGKSARICDLVAGDILRKASSRSGRPRKSGGWACVVLPSGRTGYVRSEDMEDFEKWASSREPSADNIIATAKLFTGVPYLWGGMSSKGLDCSGLTRLTWFLNGMLLPRNASQQVHTGKEVEISPDPSYKAGSRGLREEMERRIRNLQAGDLVFFGTPAGACMPDGSIAAKDRITHVGIYIGDGHIIHSSHRVRINSLLPGEDDYYENSHRLIRARRIVGHEDNGITPILRSPAYFPKPPVK